MKNWYIVQSHSSFEKEICDQKTFEALKTYQICFLENVRCNINMYCRAVPVVKWLARWVHNSAIQVRFPDELRV